MIILLPTSYEPAYFSQEGIQAPIVVGNFKIFPSQ